MADTTAQVSLLRIKEVTACIGLSVPSIYRRIADLVGLGHAGEVPGLGLLEGACQIAGRIPLGAARGNRVPEHLAGKRTGAMGGLDDAAGLDSAQGRQQSRHIDLGDRQVGDGRQVFLDQPTLPLDRSRAQALLCPLGQQFGTDCAEGVGGTLCLGHALHACGVRRVGPSFTNPRSRTRSVRASVSVMVGYSPMVTMLGLPAHR